MEDGPGYEGVIPVLKQQSKLLDGMEAIFTTCCASPHHAQNSKSSFDTYNPQP